MKEVNKRKMLDALSKSRGIVSVACKLSGLSRSSYLNWKKSDLDFAAAVDQIQETQKDGVESKLLDNIEQGDVTSIIFYLKTRCRDRGYGNTEVSESKAAGNEAKKSKADATAMRKLGAIKTGLVRALKSEGKYSDGLKFQIDSVAQLMLRVEMLKQEIFSSDHSSVNVETSREGNVRESVSPKERLYLEYLRQMQYALRALGLNMDSKVQKGAGDDGFDEFMKQLKD